MIFTRQGETFVFDAKALGVVLNLSETAVTAALRSGAITSRTEAGQDADEGKWRLTFVHAGRAHRFVVDAGGNILARSTFPASKRQSAQAAHGLKDRHG